MTHPASILAKSFGNRSPCLERRTYGGGFVGLTQFKKRAGEQGRIQSTHFQSDCSGAHCATRKLLALHLLLATFFLAGCGAFSVGFISNPQLPPSSLTGKVASVTPGSVNDSFGNPVPVTAVALVNAGLSSTLILCGNQANLFLLNSLVQINFTSGTPCLVLVSVVVLR